MADRYQLKQDFEHIDSLTYLRAGEVIEYLHDLDSYVKIKPYGMVQIPAKIVRNYPNVFELLPPHEDNEYTQPSMLDTYGYIDATMAPRMKSYAHTKKEIGLVERGNYFMGKSKAKDVQMAARLLKMILLARKSPFINRIQEGQEYLYHPIFTKDITQATRLYQNTFEDWMYRLMGNCFPPDQDGSEQVQKWGEEYHPALYYFLVSKF